MKLALVLLAAVLAVAYAKAAKGYDKEKFEKLDVDAILKDGPRLKNFLTCLGGGECLNNSGLYKDDFVDILNTGCSKCSSSIKRQIAQLFAGATLQYPGDVAAVTAKLDPKGVLLGPLLFNVALP